MKKLIIKYLIFAFIVFFSVGTVNYVVDPANLFHSNITREIVEVLSKGKTVVLPGDINEGEFKQMMIPKLCFSPETVVIGSSHIMYIDWNSLYPNTLNAGMSGSYLGDYFSIIGLLNLCNIKPRRIVIGIDAWAFTRDVLSPRHTVLDNYIIHAKELITGKQASPIKSESTNTLLDNKKELFSFSYFQSSLNKIKTKGLSYYFNGKRSEVIVCEDETPIQDAHKITSSMRYIMAKKTFATVEQNKAKAKQQIDSKKIYQIGSEYKTVDNKIFTEFVNLIEYLQKQGIEISFYLPAYFPSMYELFKTSDDYHGIIELEEKIRELGKKKGIVVHGSYNPDIVGITDKDFADFLHMTPEKMIETYSVIKSD